MKSSRNFATALPWFILGVILLALFASSITHSGSGGYLGSGSSDSGSSWWFSDSSSSDNWDWDSGGSDGGWDSGGSDNGGWDSGGSDSGGWDSGGGDSGGW